MDYFQARYYGAALGRFTSPDPGNAGADLNNPQSWNGYSYVGNSPLVYTDPSGMIRIADIFNKIDNFFGNVGTGISNFLGFGDDGLTLCISFGGGSCGGGTTRGETSGDGGGAGGSLGGVPLFQAETLGKTNVSNASTPPTQKLQQSAPPNSGNVTCSSVLPDGRTVGSYVQQYRLQLQGIADVAVQSVGRPSNPIGEMIGAFYPIAKSNGPIDFKNNFRGTANAAFLGQAGNFAYYAIGSGILPDRVLDAGAGTYAIYSALRGQKSFSMLTGPMFSDASAASVRNTALSANGCGL